MKENVPISISTNVVKQSIRKLDPLYLAKNNVVMFIVEVGFAIASIGGLFPSIWSQFILKDSTFYFQLAAILLVTIWFATFSEAIAEYQAKASVDFLRTLEREILARKLEDGKDVMVNLQA